MAETLNEAVGFFLVVLTAEIEILGKRITGVQSGGT